METDFKKLQEQMDGLLGELGKSLGQEFNNVKEELKTFVKPIDTKIVNIDGINCVIQLMQDGVKILHPDPKTHYDSLGVTKKSCWLKQLIKRK